ncbi:MAG: hypothetical protein L0J73_12265 [Halomonas sp.]|nr:hypothetical protein [Halomonas sp.]
MKQRNAVISIRVTQDEKDKIDARAQAKKMTTTAHAREIITGFDADYVAFKAQQAMSDQDQAAKNMTHNITQLNAQVKALSKSVRNDKAMVIIATGVVVFGLSALGVLVGVGLLKLV